MRAAISTLMMIAGCLALAGCGGSPSQQSTDETGSDTGAEIVIHRLASGSNASANSYWLEGEDAVLVFDAQPNLAAASEVVAAIEATGKPVTAIIISHYDPGHFGGLQVFQDAFPDAELLMQEEVAEQIERDLSGYVEMLREANGDDYRVPASPDRIIENRDELALSQVPIVVHTVARTEASAITMLAIPSQNALFASDLVANQMHPDFADANLDSWPRALNRLTRDFNGYTLYPGHGEPGPASLLAANQIAYLSFVRLLVERDIMSDNVASEEEINQAISDIRSNYSGWDTVTGRPAQLRRNLEAIVAQLGGELEPSPTATDD
jgi:glyoxylase-like metal-dependent hydrolase (beta-lactamase superfamily II)